MKALRRALERHGWDGDWYRRAFFDDGTPLGSATNAECRIDSIAQSWSVLSGAANPARAERAMAAVEEYLVRRGDGLVLLFTPAVRPLRRRSGLRQGVPAGHPGERRPVHPRRHLVGPRLRGARRRRQGGRAVLHPEPDQPRQHPGRRPSLQGGAVRHGGRRLHRAAARRPRRLDLVHGIGGLDVPGRRRVDPGIPPARDDAPARSLHPPCLAGLRDRLPLSLGPYEIVVENPQGVSRGVASSELDGQALAGGGAAIPLVDDGATHRVRVVLG